MSRLFPHTLKDSIEKAARPIFKKRGFSEARIISDWPAIVGDELARHTIPSVIHFDRGQGRDGILTISTHPAFALELQQISPQILEKIACYFGYRAIARIHILQHYHPQKETLMPSAITAPVVHTELHRQIAADAKEKDPLLLALARLDAIRHLKG